MGSVRPAASAASCARRMAGNNGVRVHAVAQHHVQQEHRRLWVLGLADDAPRPQVEVNHGMGPALGELFLAQVQAGVPLAAVWVG